MRKWWKENSRFSYTLCGFLYRESDDEPTFKSSSFEWVHWSMENGKDDGCLGKKIIFYSSYSYNKFDVCLNVRELSSFSFACFELIYSGKKVINFSYFFSIITSSKFFSLWLFIISEEESSIVHYKVDDISMIFFSLFSWFFYSVKLKTQESF